MGHFFFYQLCKMQTVRQKYLQRAVLSMLDLNTPFVLPLYHHRLLSVLGVATTYFVHLS